jgi:hypothetical protein
MTEAEWLTCEEPAPMLSQLRGIASTRKLRLFACLCCRRVWHLLEVRGRHAVEMAEGLADQLIGDGVRIEAEIAANRAYFESSGDERPRAARAALLAVGSQLNPTQIALLTTTYDIDSTTLQLRQEQQKEQSQYLLELFGNPYHGLSLDPDWLTSTVILLATSIYVEQAFDRMPILADALEDAGCDDADILAHCRGPGPHVRGCWVVDAILGKS